MNASPYFTPRLGKPDGLFRKIVGQNKAAKTKSLGKKTAFTKLKQVLIFTCNLSFCLFFFRIMTSKVVVFFFPGHK